jgi:hypothetical protein
MGSGESVPMKLVGGKGGTLDGGTHSIGIEHEDQTRNSLL